MIYDEFTRIASHALASHSGVTSLRIVAIEPSGRGPIVRWEAPLLARERERRPMGVLGPVAGPTVLDVLVRTLSARWWRGAPHCPTEWQTHLANRHKRVFTRVSPSTGPGWFWLWEAGAEAIKGNGIPRNFRTTDAKEKFGTIRWYHEADEDSQVVDNILDSVEHLSAFICEDCGRPGRIRKVSWLRCQCNVHAKQGGQT